MASDSCAIRNPYVLECWNPSTTQTGTYWIPFFATNASPAWRVIEADLQLPEKGIVWRVGDGRKNQIQRDQWIPREEGLGSASFIRRSRRRWVNQLMLPDRRAWNEELIRQIFYPFDADEFCRIKIPNAVVDDRIAWHYESTGVYREGAQVDAQHLLVGQIIGDA